MEYIILAIILVIVIILSKFIFRVNFKVLKGLEKNEKLEKITDKFPSNVQIAEEILDILDCNFKRPKIEEAKNTKTSLYIWVTNKIVISDMKNNYARIQTISHECVHSCQDKRLLGFNFFLSNINIIVLLAFIVLTLLKIIDVSMFYVAIILVLGILQFSIRGFLEIDAMTKARYLAEDYINSKKIITKKEKEKLLTEYDKINKKGIPFVVDNLFAAAVFKTLIFVAIGIFL